MKSTIVGLVGLIVAAAALPAAAVPPFVQDREPGFCGYVVNAWQDEQYFATRPCGSVTTWAEKTSQLLGAYYGTPSSKCEFRYDLECESSPDCTVGWLSRFLAQSRLTYLATHGVDLAEFQPPYGQCFLVEWYNSQTSFDIRFREIEGTPTCVISVSDIVRIDFSNGSRGLCLKPSGIAKLRFLAGDSFILVADYCYSAETAAWDVPETAESGPALIAWTGESDALQTADTFWDALRTVGCVKHDEDSTKLNTVGDMEPSEDAVIRGWRGNQLSRSWGCDDPAGVWLHTSAYAGAVRMAYVGEDSASTYRIIADGETVAEFSGRLSDGYNTIRCYSAPVSPTCEWFACVEIDCRGWKTYSQPFTWQSTSGVWDSIAAFDGASVDSLRNYDWDVAPDDAWAAGDARFDWVDGYEAWLGSKDPHWISRGIYEQLLLDSGEDCPLCGDYVLYSSVASGIDVAALAYQIELDSGGKAVIIRSGSSDPQTVTSALLEVVQANAAYGGGQFPVDPGPTLMIVGRDIGCVAFPDNLGESCRGTCRSVNLMTDVYGQDSIPDCPVQLLQVTSQDELHTMCAYAHDWNVGTDVDAERHGIFLMWDWKNLGAHDGMNPEMERTRNLYLASDLLSGGAFLKRSEFEVSELKPAVRGAFADGVRDVWSMGFVGSLCGEKVPWLDAGVFAPPGLPRDQIVMVVAPTCASASGGGAGVTPIHRRLLVLQDPDETRAAALIGHLNGAYDTEHVEWMRVLRNEFGNHAPGTDLALVVHHACRTMAEQNAHYAAGVCMHGAYAKLRDGFVNGASVVESPLRERGLQLCCLQRTGCTDVRFSLAAEAEVRLNVFDVNGRLISRVKNGILGGGEYTFTWFWKDEARRPVADGVYFVNLSIGGGGGDEASARAFVVR